MNSRMEELTGYTLIQLKGEFGYRYLLADSQMELLKKATERRKRGITDTYQLKLRRKDGSEFWAEIIASPVFDREGQVVASLAAINDITRRIEALEALKSSEARFRSYFELSLVGMATTNLNKQWIDVNNKFCELLGYTREELFRSTWAELTHPEDLQKDIRHFEGVVRGEIDGYSLEKRYIKKSGETLYAKISVNCVRETTGEVKYFVALIQDISEFKRAQNELIKQREFLKQIIDANPNPIFAKSESGIFVLANQALAKLYHTTTEKIIGRHNSEFVGTHADVERHISEDREVFRTSMQLTVPENKFVDRLTGEVRWFQTTKVLCDSADGSSKIVLGVAADITDRKRAEDQTIALQKQLLHSQKMEAIGQLAAGLAHDLNNALAGVVGHLQLLKMDTRLPLNANRSVTLALSGCERASSLIERLLSFAKQGDFFPKLLNLEDEVRGTLEFLQGAVGRNTTISFSTPTTLSPKSLSVKADPDQLHQVLTNLVINADHAMPKGGEIKVALRAVQAKPKPPNGTADTQREYVVIDVQDSGSGIRPEHLDKIFEPFFTTKSNGQGSGLGLSMVYGIVQAHGGWIDVQSELGQGSTFSVYLPQCSDSNARDSDLPAPSPTQSARPRVAKKILIVDDESTLVDLAQQFFQLAGFDTVGHTAAQQALDYFQTHSSEIDLVIMDVRMPGLNGADLLPKLRQINPNIRIGVLSGFIDESLSKEVFQWGATKLFKKPVKYPELVSWATGVLANTSERTP